MNQKVHHLVGKVAYLMAKDQFEAEQDGAFFVLKQLTPGQLIGFVNSAEQDAQHYGNIAIKFPRSTMVGCKIDEKYLVDDSAVNVRNADDEGKIIFTNDLETDVKESLSNKSSIGHEDIISAKSAAATWLNVLKSETGAILDSNGEKKAEAFIKAVFKQSDIALSRIVNYLYEVIKCVHAGEPLKVAAGSKLEQLGLPRHEQCFEKVEPETQAGKWTQALEAHRKNESFLSKRDHQTNLLDDEILGKAYEVQKKMEDGTAGKLAETILKEFKAYIEAEGRCKATEEFLFKNDWSLIRVLFSNEKKTSTADFLKETRKALEHDNIKINDEIEDLLKNLSKKRSRPSGKASNEIKDFFDTYQSSITKYSNPRLLKSWEDYVIGKKIECTDFYEGLIQCIRKFHKDLGGKKNLYLHVGALRQGKINDFYGIDPKICGYFENYFGGVEKFMENKVRLSLKAAERSLLFSYSAEVHAKEQKIKGLKKTNNSTKNNKYFEFKISLAEENDGETADTIIASINLLWAFPKASILEKEHEDLESILKASSPMIFCKGAYETVGKKGVPLPLNLKDAKSFNDAPGAKGSGSFVPAQVKIKTITSKIGQFLESEVRKNNINKQSEEQIINAVIGFESSYKEALEAFKDNRTTATKKISTMGGNYRELLKLLYDFPNESVRKNCLKQLLSVGSVDISEDNDRPGVVVICPWHPLRLEALDARSRQIKKGLLNLLQDGGAKFSDGPAGSLFFDDLLETAHGKLAPELAVNWKGMEALELFNISHFGGYSIHAPLNSKGSRSSVDNSIHDANTVINELNEYLRLQPHEKDNLSVVIYNCESQSLPQLIVSKLEKENDKSEQKGHQCMNCEVILTHQKQKSLQDVYKSLISLHGSDAEQDGSADFLSKVRINISAMQDFRHRSPLGQTPPADLVYCKDLLSSKSTLVWSEAAKITSSPEDLYTHRWNRSLPHKTGDASSKVLLCCPSQTKNGWAYLRTLAKICVSGSLPAWNSNEVMLPTKSLDFDNHEVSEILAKSHELGVWVVNSDEMLDKRLLEDKSIKVIRYIQSVSHGRNLVISSTAQDTLLRVTLNERLRKMSSDLSDEEIEKLTDKFINEANAITGGLVLKAARRANNTSELLGMVLSKFLIQAELGAERPICWCSLDDYSNWLGKASGDFLADLLVLCPDYRDGKPHLDIIVTEAKYVTQDNLNESKKRSAKQLKDTLLQVSKALSISSPADQDLWISRLSDLILSRMTGIKGRSDYSAEKWRNIVRSKQCTFSLWGYSQVFVHQSNDSFKSDCPGVGVEGEIEVKAQQEIFNEKDTRTLISQFQQEEFDKSKDLRISIGHTGFSPAAAWEINQAECTEALAKEKEDAKTEAQISDTSPLNTTDSEQQDEDDLPSTTNKKNKDPEKEAHTNTCADSLSSESNLMELLKLRCAEVKQEEPNKQWLDDSVQILRNALQDKNMSAHLANEIPPVLTPNAAIINFKGGPNLTIPKLEKELSEFYTTYGIKILRITPGLGIISLMIERPERQVLYSAEILYKYLKSDQFNPNSEKILIGVREEDGQAQMLDPFSDPHTLISGKTGSGKTVLIQTMLLYIGLTRSPDKAIVYIVDGKGTDFVKLKELPHIKKGSGIIVTKKAESIKILKDLENQMEARNLLFAEAECENIQEYRNKTGASMPTIFYFQDEFASWMKDPEYASEITQHIDNLSIKARSAGIFLVLGLQRPDNTVMPMQLRSNLGNRLTLQVADSGTAEIAVGEKKSGAEKLLGKGHMLAKIEGKLIPAQVPFTHPDLDLKPLVQAMVKKYSHDLSG